MGTPEAPDAAYVLGHSAQELERFIAQSQLFEPFTAQFFRAAGITNHNTKRSLSQNWTCG